MRTNNHQLYGEKNKQKMEFLLIPIFFGVFVFFIYFLFALYSPISFRKQSMKSEIVPMKPDSFMNLTK